MKRRVSRDKKPPLALGGRGVGSTGKDVWSFLFGCFYYNPPWSNVNNEGEE